MWKNLALVAICLSGCAKEETLSIGDVRYAVAEETVKILGGLVDLEKEIRDLDVRLQLNLAAIDKRLGSLDYALVPHMPGNAMESVGDVVNSIRSELSSMALALRLR